MKNFKSGVAYGLILSLGWMVVPSPVQAYDLSILGAVTVSNYAVTPALTSSSSGLGLGAGGTVGFDLMPFISAETGLLFMTHSFSTPNAGATSSLTYNYVDVPLLLRFSVISLVSLNVGAYYAFATSTSLSGPVSPELTSGTNPAKSDFGLLGGVSVRLPLAPLMRLRMDALYEFGLANISSGSASQSTRSLSFLAGVMFDFG